MGHLCLVLLGENEFLKARRKGDKAGAEADGDFSHARSLVWSEWGCTGDSSPVHRLDLSLSCRLWRTTR